ncbi:MAG: ABC transporter ATP-binding protein, partial [Oscillospiraceae bacterium]|nr:ABC transporter ATP-binding protein [Oscillospiraceae bacterium]
MIEVKKLSKSYGNKLAVDNISFTANDSEILGFLGPNGAGKSTTMNILTGYLSSSGGQALIDGIDILEDPYAAKKSLGYLPEQPPLYIDMTVSEYLSFVYGLKRCKYPKRSHLGEICELVRIGDVKDRVILNLSKGYRQRVGLAQALVGNPRTLILDEPTVGLDPKQIIEIRTLIK